MSAMSANFAVAPAHVRSTAAIRRAGRASAKRVIARGVIKAEAVKEAVALNTTKSDQVRLPSRAALSIARASPNRPRAARGGSRDRGRRALRVPPLRAIHASPMGFFASALAKKKRRFTDRRLSLAFFPVALSRRAVDFSSPPADAPLTTARPTRLVRRFPFSPCHDRVVSHNRSSRLRRTSSPAA